MRHRALRFALAIGVALVGHAPSAVDAHPWLPITLHFQRTYDIEPNQFTETMMGPSTYEGQPTILMIRASAENPGGQRWHYVETASGDLGLLGGRPVSTHRDLNIPAQLVLPGDFPGRDAWTYDYDHYGYYQEKPTGREHIHIDARAYPGDVVTVPAGTFDTYRVEEWIRFTPAAGTSLLETWGVSVPTGFRPTSSSADSLFVVSWYAKDVGLVRLEASLHDVLLAAKSLVSYGYVVSTAEQSWGSLKAEFDE